MRYEMMRCVQVNSLRLNEIENDKSQDIHD